MTAIITDSTRSIFKSAASFFSGTMLSRITGMLRDMSMAYAFGTSSAIAALLVAFRFAHLLRRLFGEGAMQTALVPHFEEIRLKDKNRAGIFFKDLTASLTCFLSLIILLIMGSLYAASSFQILDPGNQEIAGLTFIMMPSLLFICLFGINASLLQCEKNFFYSSAAPIAFNLIWIFGVICSAHLPVDQAVYRLSYFIIFASFGQWFVTLPVTLSALKKISDISFYKGTKLFSKDVRSLCTPLALGIIGVGAAQINNAMDAIFARWADSEGPAFLWYAIRLQQLPLALFGVALSSALLPPLSRAIKAHDHRQSEKFLNFATLRTIQFTLPITFGLLILGKGCVNLIYGYGDFSESSINGTALCLSGYTLGLIPMALVLVLAPAFYAAGDYKTPSKAALGSMITNLLLNALLVGVFNLGAVSVAIATSVSAFINIIWLGLFYPRLKITKAWFSKSLTIQTLKIFIVTLFVSFICLSLDQLFWSDVNSLNASKFSQILRLSVLGIPFLGLLFYALKARSTEGSFA